eukprot:718536-Pleurochrysis_carterae.AAC.1
MQRERRQHGDTRSRPIAQYVSTRRTAALSPSRRALPVPPPFRPQRRAGNPLLRQPSRRARKKPECESNIKT